MKFSIETNALKKGLDIVNHAVSFVSTTPILENILIKVNFNNIVLISNNLEMAIEYLISDNIKIETEGSFCLPAKLFSSYISLLSDDNIQIELLKNSLVSLSTQSSKVKIKGIEAREFPLIPSIKDEVSINIDSKILIESIEKTLFSATERSIRPTLAGIFVDIKKDEIIFASTDSLRLTEYKNKINTLNNQFFSQIIPSKTCFELKSILTKDIDVKVVYGENQISFFYENIKIFSRLLNGKFPDYNSFFPQTYSTKFILNRSDLVFSLRRLNLISKENKFAIKISFDSEIGITLDTSQTQIGEGNIIIKGDLDGENNIIGINSTFLLEALSVIDTTYISISFETALSPIMISPVEDKPDNSKQEKKFRHIIMPLKI